MKLTVFFLLLATLQIKAEGYSQGITISAREAPLEKIFNEIKKQSGYSFVYTRQLLQHSRKVTLDVKNAALQNVLNECFRDQPVTYAILNQTVVLQPKATPQIQEASEPPPPVDVKGRVVNEKGEPVVASVMVKGTQTGTVTNELGWFELRSIDEEAVLVISGVSIETQEVKLGGRTELVVKVKMKVTAEDEVTVMVNTGYQSLPKERATGSFVQVGNELLNRRVSTDIMSRLEDVASGLIFNRGAGSTPTPISIRGQSTIYSSTRPLLVIDNFPYEGDINTINPNDVESITLLKDAAAASIWGVKAGNGVIVITTKKGKYNQPVQIGLNSNLTVKAKPDLFYAPRMSSADYIEIEKGLFSRGYYQSTENSVNKTALSPVVELLIARRDGKLSAPEADARIEALKELDSRKDFNKYFNRQSINQQYAINLSGGSGNQRYYVSLGYDQNLSESVGNDYNRITLNATNTYAFLKQKLEITTGIQYSQSKSVLNNPGYSSVVMNIGSSLYPYARIADEQGMPVILTKDYRTTYLQSVSQSGQGLLDWTYKPLEEINHADNQTRLTNYHINLGLKYKLTQGLNTEVLYQYRNSLSGNRNYQSSQSYYTRNQINMFTIVNSDGTLSRPIPLGGILDWSNSNTMNQNLRLQMVYNKNINHDHDISILSGYEISESNGITNTYRLYGYDDEHAISKTVDYNSNFISYVNPQAKNNQILNKDNIDDFTDRYLSWYANAAYTYKGRYTLSGSGRLDRANLFGVKANQKGVPLYSAGLGWVINEEPLYNLAILPKLKLRLTYGYNGNINKSLSAYTTARYDNGSTTETRLPNARVINPPNPELRWERVRILNLGLDFATKKNILSGSLEYYRKWGLDLIGDMVIAPSSGIVSFRGNTASTSGQGVDITLNSMNMNNGIKWNTSILLSHISEKVTGYKIKSTPATYVSGQGSPLAGKPLFAIYSYPWAGLDPQTGDPQGYLNGEISKDYTKIMGAYTPENILYHGSSRPTTFGVVRNTFTWKSLAFSFSVSYRMGYYFRKNSIAYGSDYGLNSQHGDYALRWQKTGDEKFTQVPSAPLVSNINRNNLYMYSEILVGKGDHIRLQDVSLTYELKKTQTPKLSFTSVRVYLYANNLGLLWSANSWKIDPDFQNMPPANSIAAGLKIDL